MTQKPFRITHDTFDMRDIRKDIDRVDIDLKEARGNSPTLKDKLDNMVINAGGHIHNNQETLDKLSENGSNLLFNGAAIASGSGGGLLIYNTLTDLQNAYPNGVDQPVWVKSEKSWFYWNGTITDTTAPTVSVSPSGGTYTTGQSVTLTTNETATIYYTTDGSTPTETSAVYSGAITISATTTLKFFAKDSAGNSSAVQSVTYTIDATATDTTAPVLTITPSQTFTDSMTVTMSTDEIATIWYTLDDTDPITSATRVEYTAAITLTETDTIKAYAVDGSGNASAVQTVTYTKEVSTSPIGTDQPPVTDSLYARFDASQLSYADGASVTQWDDLSGYGRNGILSGSLIAPVMDIDGLNGLKSVRFTGSGVGLEVANGIPMGDTGSFTVLVVFNQESSGTYPNLYSTNDNDDGYIIWTDPGNSTLALFKTGSLQTIAGSTTAVTFNTGHISYTSFDAPNKSGGSALNGEVITSGTSTATASYNTMNIGSHNSNEGQTNTSLQGVISEIIVYSKVLTDTERGQVEQYLSNKWAITLSV